MRLSVRGRKLGGVSEGHQREVVRGVRTWGWVVNWGTECESQKQLFIPTSQSYSVPNEPTIPLPSDLLGSERGHLLIPFSPLEGPAPRGCWLCAWLEWQWAL